jgi:hypothetical protein
MSNEIELHNPQQALAMGAPRRLTDWAEEAQAASTLARGLCSTSFVPTAFRDKPLEATAAILAGSEMGLSPLAALNAYDVIQGRPAPKALTLRAVVQSHGHDIVPLEMTNTKCVMKGRRKGNADWITVEWNIKRAQDMKLTTKPNWQTQPQAMLIARATSEIARLIAADVLMGVPYSAEELADEMPAPTVRVSRAKTAPAPMPEPDLQPAKAIAPSRAAAPASEPEPDFDEPFPSHEHPTPSAQRTTDRINADMAKELIDPHGGQMKALHAGLNDLGMGAREAALAFIVDVLDKPVESSKDLTRADATKVLAALDELRAEPFPTAPPADAA